jgi:hypothetical protein
MTSLLIPVLAHAEAPPEGLQGWTFSQRFQGSSNAAGVVLKTSSTATYSFNRYIKAYAGIPVYFARATSSTGSTEFMNGIGNAYSGLVVTAGSTIHYTSDLVATAPTGDTSRGFSTGHPTVDWTNTFSHSFSAITPYLSVGAANTISDTSFFVRPFSSKGIVGHYELGTLMNVAPRLSIGGSAYGVRATGEQEIISKVVEKPVVPQPATTTVQQSSPGGVLGTITNAAGLGKTPTGGGSSQVPVVFETQQQTLGPAAVANDHGFSTWLSVRPGSSTDFQIGYSRSQTYQLNSLFFGAGFRVGR